MILLVEHYVIVITDEDIFSSLIFGICICVRRYPFFHVYFFRILHICHCTLSNIILLQGLVSYEQDQALCLFSNEHSKSSSISFNMSGFEDALHETSSVMGLSSMLQSCT